MCSVLALVLLSFRSVSEQAKYVYRTYFVVKFSRFKASVVRLLQKKITKLLPEPQFTVTIAALIILMLTKRSQAFYFTAWFLGP
jgi:hypothetical protein